MNDKAKIGAAIVGGYLLGRTRKGKLALSLTLWVAGSQLGLDPKKLVRDSLIKLGQSPQVERTLEQLRGPVADAGRKAAVATLESRVNQLADRLHERTNALGGNSRPAGDASSATKKTTKSANGGSTAKKTSAKKTSAKKTSSSQTTRS